MRNRPLVTSLLVAVITLTSAPAALAAPNDVPPKGKDCWATHYGSNEPGGQPTASGEPYASNKNTAATSLHRSPQLKFDTKVKVINVMTGKNLTVKINDRMDDVWTHDAPKCLRLTNGAFRKLGGDTTADSHIVVKETVLD